MVCRNIHRQIQADRQRDQDIRYVHIFCRHGAVRAGSLATLDVDWLGDAHTAVRVCEVETDGVFLDRSARILHLHTLLAARLLWVIDDHTRPLQRKDNASPSQITLVLYTDKATPVPVIIFVYPLTTRFVGAPQMISQPAFSIFPVLHCPLGPAELQACLPTSSSSCLVFFPLSLCLARWFWPDLMNGRHDHTTAVCVSLRSSGLRVVQLPAGSWHGLPRW